MSRSRRKLIAGACTLAVLCAGCKDRRFPTDNDDPAESFFELSTANNVTSLPADGFSTLTITAKISSSAVQADRAVRFRSTGGSFVGAATGTPLQVDAPFDATGRAVAVLRSSGVTGPVLVTAQVLDGTSLISTVSELRLEFVLPDGSGLRFVEAPASAPADGGSVTRFTVRVPDGAPLDQRTVAFGTTLASFDGATNRSTTVNAGIDGLASVLLYSPIDDGIAELSATLGVFRVETIVAFRVAVAETILVESPARVAQNATMNVKATLVRSIGIPTRGTVVTFQAFDSIGRAFGSFTSVTRSDATGAATATFAAGGTGTPGRGCRIEARADGSHAVGSAEFELVPPPPP